MMKAIIVILAICSMAITLSGQDLNPDYDSVLAKQLGADELGMKMYILVILKSGNAKIEDSVLRATLFKGHFENMKQMSAMGKLISAGPLENNNQFYRGIFIFDVNSIDEVQELLQGDPTIKEGIFEPLLYRWYGSAALPEYVKIHKKIQKIEIQ